jgi:hypothetical protein
MYKLLLFVLAAAGFLLSCANIGSSKQEAGTKPDSAAAASKDTTKKSVPSEVSKTIGNATIRIAYHAPAVRGRVIWGGLVPYDAVWVTGAHKATSLEVEKDFKVGEKTIPAGKYAIFSIPRKEQWTIILNKNWNQHLADDYSEADDVARVRVKPQSTAETTERLAYAIEPKGEKSATITVIWEKIRVPFELRIL